MVGSVGAEADLPTNYTGKLGDMFIVTSTGGGFVWDGKTWISVGRVQGPKGDKGDKGDKGCKALLDLPEPRELKVTRVIKVIK
ncbi:MAG: hypothetical protein IPL23_10750 [Saprospiraceae bacterium]|nr:hypothetical protein [Saprospiraceae bacterium]